jgi:hypothetical protein
LSAIAKHFDPDRNVTFFRKRERLDFLDQFNSEIFSTFRPATVNNAQRPRQ